MTAEPDADFDSIAAAIAGRTGSSFNPRSASPVGGGAQLGVALAQLHRVTGALFGWRDDNSIGATAQCDATHPG